MDPVPAHFITLSAFFVCLFLISVRLAALTFTFVVDCGVNYISFQFPLQNEESDCQNVEQCHDAVRMLLSTHSHMILSCVTSLTDCYVYIVLGKNNMVF
jgi:hypothetical protein